MVNSNPAAMSTAKRKSQPAKTTCMNKSSSVANGDTYQHHPCRISKCTENRCTRKRTRLRGVKRQDVGVWPVQESNRGHRDERGTLRLTLADTWGCHVASRVTNELAGNTELVGAQLPSQKLDSPTSTTLNEQLLR